MKKINSLFLIPGLNLQFLLSVCISFFFLSCNDMQKEKQRQAKQDKMDSLVAVANNKQLSVSVRRTAAWEALDLDPSVFDPDTFASFMTHLKILEDDSVRDAQAMAMIEQDRAQFRMIQSFETKRDSCLKIGQKKNASLMQSRIDSLWHRIFSQ